MKIADLIRQYLGTFPITKIAGFDEYGASTEQIHCYCKENGGLFKVTNIKLQKKSVSGQLSKMRAAGKVTYKKIGNRYLWRLAN